MKKVALIEDDADLFGLLKYNLEKEGFQFVGALKGAGALDLFTRERPDLILLDIMLPDCDGLELCKLVRRTSPVASTPIILLTARASEADRILGLELGADDYIPKPFYLREVIARIKVRLRPRVETPPLLKADNLELDRAECRVRLDGKDLDLTATEFRLLEFLLSRRGVVFSRAQLLDAAWGITRSVTERTVDVFILRLRQKLEADPANPRLICSVRGFGYCFQAARESS
jgi:DNA-binding response OmpR family regulator